MVTTENQQKNRPATVGRYFRAIDAALDGLETYLREDDSPLYNHELIGSVLAGYIDRLNHSFRAWENRISFADRFRINQAESGYPLYRNVLDLDNDAKTASKQLAEMPPADTLRQDMVDYILLKKKFPGALQKAMAKRLYLEEVLEGDVFQPFILPKTIKVSVNSKTGRPFYVVHWGSFDGSANLPMVYIAVIEDSSKDMQKLLMSGDRLKKGLDIPFPIEGLLNPELAHQFDDFCEKNSAYGLTLATIADNMDRDFEFLHPVQLRRIVMGPFYSAGVTSHGRIVENILEQVSQEDNAWMLTWTVQELFSVSESPAKWGLWGSTPAKQTYHIDTNDLEAVQQGVSAYQRHALIPHEAYQAIYASGKTDAVFTGYSTHVISGSQVLRDF
ncbi:MAG: hypothetical protein GKR97_00035 [Rhizobiaceae bacterium]|nr:hypothetical protein [Rhizobiaceae bacterium]